jgi:DUF4097 and DUF4098 domain-containing protein YvlB
MRQERFDTPGKVEVRVDNKLGDVRLRTHAEPTTEVELRANGPRADEILERVWVEQQDFDGNQSVIVEVRSEAGFMQRRGDDVVVTVRLPEGASVDVQTISGSVTGEGNFGAARARTTSGDISLGSVDGDLVARSTSGDVTVVSVTGNAEVATMSGDVRCGALNRTGLLKTASGDVNVDSTHGPLTIETMSGDVTAGQLADGCDLKTVSGSQRVRQLVAGNAQFKTVSGDMTIAVARGTAVMIDAESLSGTLSSEIELSSDEPDGSSPDQGGPSAQLRARSVSGDVRIQRSRA